MLVSYNWLKKFVKLPDSITAEKLGLKLTMSTVEVEGMENPAKDLANVVVGKIIKVDKHPDADKLKICIVDIGSEKLQVVCGGINVVEGMLVALAKIGTRVRWHGEGDLVELVLTKIRGVESFGMICAASEIGLDKMFAEKEKEILDLTLILKNKKNILGKSIATVLDLNDTIFDIDNKSMTHRPDLWGHYGLAREVAAIYHREVAKYETNKIKPGKKEKIKATVADSKLCPRYMAVRMDGIVVGESPEWLKKQLSAVGQKSINNIVDVTNYLMLELGQPMHAFDAKKLVDENIFVRLAKDKEKIKLLDERIIELTVNDLVIADSQKPVALAGVMGGYDSAIDANTNSIVLESATFDSTIIRKTAFHYDARTDSSARFEKSLDPNNTLTALSKAVEMIQICCPQAVVTSNVVDVVNFSLAQGPLQVSVKFLQDKIGMKIEEKEIISILTRLGFMVEKKKEILLVKIPTWRATKDISLPEDLVEEVARIYGYDNIIPQALNFPVVPPVINRLRQIENSVRDSLVKGLNYTEVYNYSFISGRQIDQLKENKKDYLELDKPLSQEKPYLRRQLLPNLLDNVVNNIETRDEVRIMEIGKTYLAEEAGVRVSEKNSELLPRQNTWVVAVYAKKKMDNPFNEVRRALENIMADLGVKFSIKPWGKAGKQMHPTRAGEIVVNEVAVGNIYEVNPEIVKNFGLETRAGVVEINLDLLEEQTVEKIDRLAFAPTYPEIIRDLAFVVDKKITNQNILEIILPLDVLIKKLELFDVYQGSHMADNEKSMAYRLTYGADDCTLINDEVNKIQEKVIKILIEKFKIRIRE